MTAQQPRLGILGGMGPQATQVFYQRILDKTDARRDQEHLPTLIWSDTGMPDRTQAILSGQTEPVYQRLLADARLLEREGCTVLAIPCNTSHYFADRLQRELSIPLMNMIRLTAAAMKKRGCRRVGLLATDGTVRTGIYQAECAAQGPARSGMRRGRPGLHRAERLQGLPRGARAVSGRHGRAGGGEHPGLRLSPAASVSPRRSEAKKSLRRERVKGQVWRFWRKE